MMQFAVVHEPVCLPRGGLAPWTAISDDHGVLWTSTGWGQRFRQQEPSIATPSITGRARVFGSIGTENRLKGDHPTARPQDLSDFEGVGALRASRPQAG